MNDYHSDQGQSAGNTYSCDQKGHSHNKNNGEDRLIRVDGDKGLVNEKTKDELLLKEKVSHNRRV